jgi:hypothetical protein
VDGADFFNVFAASYETMATETFGDARVEGRILYRSPDYRQLIIATRYPDGVTFVYGGPVDYQEAFFVARGHGTRTSEDGRVVEMNAGDLIYVRPHVEIEYVYDPGFLDVAFFWSEARLSADLTGHLTSAQVGC